MTAFLCFLLGLLAGALVGVWLDRRYRARIDYVAAWVRGKLSKPPMQDSTLDDGGQDGP